MAVKTDVNVRTEGKDTLNTGDGSQGDPASSLSASVEDEKAASAREVQTTERVPAELQTELEAATVEESPPSRNSPAALKDNSVGPPLDVGEVPQSAAAPSTQTVRQSTNTSALTEFADEIRALLARGDALIAKSDVASARLFYERAAETGDGQAALRVGESYDPAFLARAHLSGVRGDASAAARLYRQAHVWTKPKGKPCSKASRPRRTNDCHDPLDSVYRRLVYASRHHGTGVTGDCTTIDRR